MVNKCLYCGAEVSHEGLSVCEACGVKIWGKKMYEAILKNMAPPPKEEE